MGFNFETIMQVCSLAIVCNPYSSLILDQAHDSQIRAISYSHGEDWVVSADQEGVVKYWQTNFNNVKALQAHNECIRDLAFSPNDSKFVTASDDASLKIFDFAGGTEESTLTGHNWEAKTVDWHPTKGLLVSGSKDHQVKLWDPRTSRVLTTLHGHKAAISKVAFEPLRGQLLATGARDSTARIFDLRMMRDTCLLRGAEKDISTLVWHPIHVNLLTTGGLDGAIMHYLLDEPNTPAGTVASIGPYDSTDPSNAPVQGIWPAHRLQHAHEYAVWSLAWHPLGHILASGSNDRTTRFWTRARPGDVDCFKDRYHLGDSAAEAQGTWDRRNNNKMMREQEEQEAEDEAEGLVDQKMPAAQPVLPGLPGLALPTMGSSDGTSTGGAQKKTPAIPENFAPPLPFPGTIPGMDPKDFAALVASGQIPLPPPIGANVGNGLPPPPLPLPPNFDFSKVPPGMVPPGFQPPPGFAPPPALPGMGAESTAAGRRRAPLPSQQESLMEEQRRGKYRIAR